MSVRMSVPEAARALGVTERTVWRRIHSGKLETEREGRRIYVRLPEEYPLAEQVRGEARGAAAVSEALAEYSASGAGRSADAVPPGSVPAWMTRQSFIGMKPGPWPYTEEKIRERQRIEREEEREQLKRAFEAMDRIHADLKPWPPGYDFERFLREWKDEDRAWEGLLRGERAIRARNRRRRQ